MKVQLPNAKMSNLVNMYAFVWEGDNIINRVFIYGKADESHFLVQAISAIDGTPNICKLKTIEEMKDWIFYPTKELADFCYEDWCKHKINRFK